MVENRSWADAHLQKPRVNDAKMFIVIFGAFCNLSDLLFKRCLLSFILAHLPQDRIFLISLHDERVSVMIRHRISPVRLYDGKGGGRGAERGIEKLTSISSRPGKSSSGFAFAPLTLTA